MVDVEKIRQSFRPDKVSIFFFLGESAPASGRFFYTGDSLCTYTKEAFIMAFPERVFLTTDEFLQFFKKTVT